MFEVGVTCPLEKFPLFNISHNAVKKLIIRIMMINPIPYVESTNPTQRFNPLEFKMLSP